MAEIESVVGAELPEASNSLLYGQNHGRPVSYLINFGIHEFRSDLGNLPAWLAEADIFIPEGVGWNQASIKQLRRIANGDYAALQRHVAHLRQNKGSTHVYSEFQEAWARAIYGTKVAVAQIDVPAGNLLCDEVVSLGIPRVLDVDRPYGSVVDQLESSLAREARIQARRDKYMVDNVPDTLNEVVSSNSRLSRRSALRVLIQLGAGHLAVYDEMRKRGADVERHFTTKPFVYLFQSEIINRLTRGMSLGADLLARGLAQSFYEKDIASLVFAAGGDNTRRVRMARTLLSFMNEANMREAYERHQIGEDDTAFVFEIIRDGLAKRGCGLDSVKSTEDIDHILGIFMPHQSHD